MREELNAIIAREETRRRLTMPRIGPGHSGSPGWNFQLVAGSRRHSSYAWVRSHGTRVSWTSIMMMKLRAGASHCWSDLKFPSPP